MSGQLFCKPPSSFLCKVTSVTQLGSWDDCDDGTNRSRVAVGEQRSHAVDRTLVGLGLLVLHVSDAAVITAVVWLVSTTTALRRRHHRVWCKPDDRRCLLLHRLGILWSVWRCRNWLWLFQHLRVHSIFWLVWCSHDVAHLDLVSTVRARTRCGIGSGDDDVAGFAARQVIHCAGPAEWSVPGTVCRSSEGECLAVVEGRHASGGPSAGIIVLRVAIVPAAATAAGSLLHWAHVQLGAAAFQVGNRTVYGGWRRAVIHKHRLRTEQLGERRQVRPVGHWRSGRPTISRVEIFRHGSLSRQHLAERGIRRIVAAFNVEIRCTWAVLQQPSA